MPLLLVYSMGGSLDPIDDYRSFYYSLIGAGYLAGFVTLFVSAARGWKIMGVKIPVRVQFDLWLGAFLCACILVVGMIYFQLPIRLRSWDAHGFGASGGEANALFLPWLHYAIWLLLLLRLKNREGLLRETNSSAGTSSEGSS